MYSYYTIITTVLYYAAAFKCDTSWKTCTTLVMIVAYHNKYRYHHHKRVHSKIIFENFTAQRCKS